MPFKPGQSGNPGGRPKAIVELVELARAATPEAFKRIVKLIRSKDERVALEASKTVVERGYGKPTQHVEANVSIFDRLPAAERSALETAIDGILADRASGTPPTTH